MMNGLAKTGPFVTLTVALMGLSTPSLAKKQFNVREELAAYNEACNPDSNRRLLETLESEPEAREFVRLLKETEKSPYSARIGLDGYIFCQVAFVPNNEALKDIEVRDGNRDKLAMVLRSHFLGGTKLEDSDFTESGTTLRSWSGSKLVLARSKDGTRTVNGRAVTGGSLTTSGHTILIISGVLPDIVESAKSAVESMIRPLGSSPYYPVLQNITGKKGMTFNEIASFCGFEERINDIGESVSILLPNEIKLVNAPVLKDLFASDKNFVCRAFTGNVIEGRYTFEEFKQLAKAGRKVRSIDGREFALSTYEGPRGQLFVRVGDQSTGGLTGPRFVGGTNEIVGERHTYRYTILAAGDLFTLDVE